MVTTSGGHSALYSFDGVNGANPWGSLTLASDGNFYGTITGGVVYNDGTVFRLTPSNTVTVLHSFSSFLIGGLQPVTPTQAADGNLYGITATGTIYRITLSSGTFQLLPNSLTDPGCGYCFATRNPLYLASDGNLYATADYDDTVFRVTTDGDITTLYDLNGSGAYRPWGSVTQGQGTDNPLAAWSQHPMGSCTEQTHFKGQTALYGLRGNKGRFLPSEDIRLPRSRKVCRCRRSPPFTYFQ